VTERIAVIGAGAWGTTLARMLAASDHPVTLWAHRPDAAAEMARDRQNRRYLADHPFPAGLLVTGDVAELRAPHRLYILAVPSAHAREILRRIGADLAPGTPFLSVVKGIEARTQARMSEVIAEEAPERAIAVLSGPNLADEVASGLPAGTVVASTDPALAADVAELLGSDQFRVYTNPDVIGVELAGALKNVIALAAGLADGLRMGDSGKAAIVAGRSLGWPASAT
jgi:glycerol-3-phosphate dehydrogenase (NAD(P)+)